MCQALCWILEPRSINNEHLLSVYYMQGPILNIFNLIEGNSLFITAPFWILRWGKKKQKLRMFPIVTQVLERGVRIWSQAIWFQSLHQKSTNFPCKGPDDKYFRLLGPSGLSRNYSTPLLEHKSSMDNTKTNEHGCAPVKWFMDPNIGIL